MTADRFSFDRMYDNEYFISLLFYMGMLTIGEQGGVRIKLIIPNFVMKTMYWDYVDVRLRREFDIQIDKDPLLSAIEAMAFQGTIKPYIDYIGEQVVKPLSLDACPSREQGLARI